MSSTVPSFRSGTEAAIFSRYSAPSPSSPSVITLPGMTALMVMLCGASSSSAVCRKPSCPALLARNMPLRLVASTSSGLRLHLRQLRRREDAGVGAEHVDAAMLLHRRLG